MLQKRKVLSEELLKKIWTLDSDPESNQQ